MWMNIWKWVESKKNLSLRVKPHQVRDTKQPSVENGPIDQKPTQLAERPHECRSHGGVDGDNIWIYKNAFSSHQS